jgi:mannosyl-oligosaccharide alpha-1,2-mannosidase
MIISRWKASVLFTLIFFIFIFLLSTRSHFEDHRPAYSQQSKIPPLADYGKNKFRWADVPQKFPVTSMKAVPTSIPKSIPIIQYNFGKETAAERKVRIARLKEVKGNFTHAWKGYRDHAWLRDEVMPLSGGSHDPFGGWAATLVDSLGSWLLVLYL